MAELNQSSSLNAGAATKSEASSFVMPKKIAPQVEKREQYNNVDGSVFRGEMKLTMDDQGHEIWIQHGQGV